MVLKPIQREKRNVLPKGLILKITHAHTHTSYLAIVMSLFYSCYILSHNNSRPSAKIGIRLLFLPAFLFWSIYRYALGNPFPISLFPNFDLLPWNHYSCRSSIPKKESGFFLVFFGGWGMWEAGRTDPTVTLSRLKSSTPYFLRPQLVFFFFF